MRNGFYSSGYIGNFHYYSWPPTEREREQQYKDWREEMAKAKRPPLAWDGKKPLKFKWGLYVGGKLQRNVVAYDIEGGWFQYRDMPVTRAPFLVKRLD